MLETLSAVKNFAFSISQNTLLSIFVLRAEALCLCCSQGWWFSFCLGVHSGPDALSAPRAERKAAK